MFRSLFKNRTNHADAAGLPEEWYGPHMTQAHGASNKTSPCVKLGVPSSLH